MSSDVILGRLTNVRRTGHGRWTAACPSHGRSSANRALAIRELEDGRTLLHCFGGCGVEEVLGAVQLELDALFPPRLTAREEGGGRGYTSRLSRPFDARQALEGVAQDVGVVAIIAGDAMNGRPIDDETRARFFRACGRIAAAVEMVR